MLPHARRLSITAFFALVVLPLSSHAAATVELELVGDPRGAAMAFQEWGRALERAGIRSVRLQTAQEPGQPRIDTQGTPGNVVYVVRGIVVSRDEIQLPGVRFRRSETGRLAQWLADLAAQGPVENREKRGAFGLSAAEMDQIRKDLATAVGSHTRDVPLQELVKKTADQLKLPLRSDVGELGDEKVKDELGTLSCGTALACALRAAGYGLVPRADGGQLGYAIVRRQESTQTWPVGQAPEQTVADMLPALYQFRNVNVQNVSAATALEAVGKALGTPVLMDHFALARHQIDPAKVTVSHPRSRTTYSVALRRMLFQARLQFEVRCDEAGTPFIWVTTVKQVK